MGLQRSDHGRTGGNERSFGLMEKNSGKQNQGFRGLVSGLERQARHILRQTSSMGLAFP